MRVKCGSTSQAYFNAQMDNRTYSGKIEQISVAGMECIFGQAIPVQAGQYLNDIQLRLRGKVCSLEGDVARAYSPFHIVVMFENSLAEVKKKKIREFIYWCLLEEVKKNL